MSAESVLELLGELSSQSPDPKRLAALHNELDSIQAQTATTNNSSLIIRDGFDALLNLVMQLRQSLVAEHSSQEKLREIIKIQQEVTKQREKVLRGIKEREDKHLVELDDTYQRVRFSSTNSNRPAI